MIEDLKFEVNVPAIKITELEQKLAVNLKEINSKYAIIDRLGEEVYQMSYSAGYSFGEKALQTGNPRGGTGIANTETYCAVVDKDLYLKVLNRLNQEKA